MEIDDFQVGRRVKLPAKLEIYPLGTFPASAEGVVIASDLTSDDGQHIAIVEMDAHFPCLEEWENCLYVYRFADEISETTELSFELLVGFT